MRMANHFHPGTPLFIRVLSSRSLRAITVYVLFVRLTFKVNFYYHFSSLGLQEDKHQLCQDKHHTTATMRMQTNAMSVR